jgi:phosphoglycerate dehydrogenase-like enzyme
VTHVNTVLVAIDDTEEDQRDQLVAHLQGELPQLEVSVAGTLDDALRAPHPTILITSSHPWLPDLVRARGSIEWVHLLSAGADRLLQQDLPFERLRVSTSSGVHAATIAEYVLAGALYHTKHFGPFARQQRERRWERGPQDDLEGRTIGIIGVGAIGAAIARRAKAFGMGVLGIKRTPGSVPDVDELHGPEGLHDVLERADVLAVTVPLTPNTRNLIGAAELGLLPEGAILVNVGRGHVVEETALAAALRTGRLRGATLDVFADEPLPADSPLWELDNVLITPHVAGDTPEYMRKAARVFAENYRSWQQEGRLTTPVDVQAGY